jgi:hypothetical protein
MPTMSSSRGVRVRAPVARAVALETSINEARWLLWPAFGLWIAFVAAGVMFG